MVKAVVGEDTRFKLAEDRLSQSGLTSQVGLLIGKLSSPLDRGFVFDLVPTPPNDASEPACSLLGSTREDNRKGSKSKSPAVDSSSLVVDKDWVAEHARQVSRMLVGGMKVIGIYVWISDTAFKNSIIMLCQTVKAVAEAAPISETDMDERLLIHICYSPRRWTCRNCSVSSNITSSSLRPCDFKMGRVLASVQTFKCMHNFNLRLPIHLESANQTFIDTLRNGISVHWKELKGANAMIDGNLVLNDEPCSTDDLHEVELLLPFMKSTFVEACCQKDVVGVLVFSGSVCSFACLTAKESISQAVADIKDDIIRSLRSRLDIICDAADEDQPPADDASIESTKEQSPGKPVFQLSLNSLRNTCSLPFPRRVFVPWLENTFICDYLQPSDTLEVLKDRCVELMSMEAPTDASTILEPEVEATTLKAKSFWDVAIPFSSSLQLSLEKDNVVPAISESREKAGKSPSINVIAAVFFLILSVLVGFLLLRRS